MSDSDTKPELSSHTPPKSKKRQRAHIACTSCRRRKIRCDAAKPHCGNCVKINSECVYESLNSSKKLKNLNFQGDDVDKIDARLDRLEKMLGVLIEQQVEEPQCYFFDDDQSDQRPKEEPTDGSNIEPEVLALNNTDILELNDRRAPAIIELGELDPLVTYSHGFTNILFLPRSIKWLCKRIGNEQLGINAERIMTEIWKSKSKTMIEWHRKAKVFVNLDPKIIEYCLELFKNSDSEILNTIIDPSELDIILKFCCPDGNLERFDVTSPYALFLPTIVLTYTRLTAEENVPEFGPFSREYADEQNLAAFFVGLNIVTSFYMAPTTFLLTRLLLLFVYSMFQRAVFPQMRVLVSTVLCMATNLGLNRDEGSRNLPPKERTRRRLVWTLIQDIDIKLAVFTSQMPLIVNSEFSVTTLDPSLPRDSEWRLFEPILELDNIYLEVYNKLFSPKAKKNSVKNMLITLLHIDEKLAYWYRSLPDSFKRTIKFIEDRQRLESEKRKARAASFDSHMSTTSIEEMLNAEEQSLREEFIAAKGKRKFRAQVGTLICYHHIMSLIHSIPAFSPSCLEVFRNTVNGIPNRLLDSLDIISQNAKSTLLLAFSIGGLQSESCIAMLITNAFGAFFLKHIRDPKHHTNNEELILMYRYITKYKYRRRTPGTPCGMPQLAMSLWLIFTNAMHNLSRDAGVNGVTPSDSESPVSGQPTPVSSANNHPIDRDFSASPMIRQETTPTTLQGPQIPYDQQQQVDPHNSEKYYRYQMKSQQAELRQARLQAQAQTQQIQQAVQQQVQMHAQAQAQSEQQIHMQQAANHAQVQAQAQAQVQAQAQAQVQAQAQAQVQAQAQAQAHPNAHSNQSHTPNGTQCPTPQMPNNPSPNRQYNASAVPDLVNDKSDMPDMWNPRYESLFNSFSGVVENEVGFGEQELLGLLDAPMDDYPLQNPSNCTIC